MKYSNGFTIVELLAVLLIIGILVTLVVPNILGIQDKMNSRALKSKISSIEISAKQYAESNANSIRKKLKSENANKECDTNIANYCECINGVCEFIYKVRVMELVDLGAYSEPKADGSACLVINPVDNSCLDTHIVTIKVNAKYNLASAKYE